MVEEETVQGAVVVRRPDDMEAAAAGDEAAVRSPLLYPGLPLAPEELFPIAYLAHKPAMAHLRRTERPGWPIRRRA